MFARDRIRVGLRGVGQTSLIGLLEAFVDVGQLLFEGWEMKIGRPIAHGREFWREREDSSRGIRE